MQATMLRTSRTLSQGAARFTNTAIPSTLRRESTVRDSTVPRDSQKSTPNQGPPSKSLLNNGYFIMGGLGLLGVVSYGIGLWPVPAKSPTSEPFDTQGSKDVENRFSSAGGKRGYQSGNATKLGDPDNTATSEVNQGAKDRSLEDKMNAKQLDKHDDESTWTKSWVKGREQRVQEHPEAHSPNHDGSPLPNVNDLVTGTR
ncbi:hypothetical protein EJ03DRAFT_327324 [Teratosphaeria nubilosa]|uniref:Uncharacterized protein n=1 Tax=Teratosphaeria nubilosa TaxID=161662 RepID=A0A6G1L960_9PEZI|nr:hypothetical protein EJ03DRAFT_327324 [Teratosphaeria nubilosa]